MSFSSENGVFYRRKNHSVSKNECRNVIFIICIWIFFSWPGFPVYSTSKAKDRSFALLCLFNGLRQNCINLFQSGHFLLDCRVWFQGRIDQYASYDRLTNVFWSNLPSDYQAFRATAQDISTIKRNTKSKMHIPIPCHGIPAYNPEIMAYFHIDIQ